MSRILLGVTGGIAAYKACELTRLLVKAGPRGDPARDARARSGSCAPRPSPRWPAGPPTDDLYQHLTRADLLVVAPCTANTLAKLAHGLADNVLTEAALAHRGPMLVAPAMNPRMWSHAATRANVETLRARGVELVGPDEGETAEGEWGVGRMAEPEEIAARIEQLLAPPSLAGKRVLVTAGGTREPLDAVRFVGNRSSGRMGVALAEEARRRGADVVLLAANLAVPAPARRRDDPDADRRGDARGGARARRHGHRAAGRGGRRLPAGRRARRQAREEQRAVDARARADDRHRAPARRAQAARPGARRLRRRARRGRARAQAPDARREERRPGRLQRRLARRHRASMHPRTRSCSSRATAIARSQRRRSA